MATYYINADTGNDTTGSGTSVAPWKTITKALTAATTNDTIFFQRATAVYPWSGTPTIVPITFTCTTLGDAVIDGGSVNFTFFMNTGNGTWNFTNMIWQNFGANADFSYLQSINSTLNFTNNIFRTFVSSGPFNGAAASGTTLNFLGCLFYGFSYVSAFFPGVIRDACANLNVTNCTYFCSAAAVNALKFLYTNGSMNVVLKNNIFYNTNSVGFNTGGTFTGSTNNDIFGFSSPPSMTNTITSDPLFVDAANANFNLRPTSPCIDAGVII